jgi:hypothetical protein
VKLSLGEFNLRVPVPSFTGFLTKFSGWWYNMVSHIVEKAAMKGEVKPNVIVKTVKVMVDAFQSLVYFTHS